MPSDTGKVSVRNYIDTFMARQGKLLGAANESNIRKRYANYQRLPQLRMRTYWGSASEEHEHPKDDSPPIVHIGEATRVGTAEERGSEMDQGIKQHRHIHQAGAGERHGSGQHR